MQAQGAPGVERRGVDAQGLDGEAGGLQALEGALGGVGGRAGVGHHEVELRAAGERLAHAKAGAYAAGLGRGRAEPDHLRAAGIGAERDRGVEGPPGAQQGDEQREARDVDGDDHRTHVR